MAAPSGDGVLDEIAQPGLAQIVALLGELGEALKDLQDHTTED